MAADKPIVVGSKIFTEGYVLGEVAAQTIEASAPPVPVVRKLGMGSTGILFQSLSSGAIDVYADYTGTLTEAIIKHPSLKSQPRNPGRARQVGPRDVGAARIQQHLCTGCKRSVCPRRTTCAPSATWRV